ncbi:MAG: hypothetical protein KF700_12135, partial [Hyphomonadaceae bacterium]|nr:hypothetical protein [Hyphomonadaceae bacterium]
MRLALAALAAFAITAVDADARTWRVRPGPEAQRELQTALIEAQPGDTVRLERGRYELTQGLSLSVDNVTIRGAGQNRTILSFAGQRRGA